MGKSHIPYIPYRSLLLSSTVLNDTTVLNDIIIETVVAVVYRIGCLQSLDWTGR